MENGVHAFQILGLHVTDVFLDFGDARHVIAEGTAFKEIAVETENVIPGLQQHGGQNGADIAVVSSNQYAHS